MSIHILAATKQHLFESTQYLFIYLESGGSPLVGQTPTIQIRRISDLQFFDDNTSDFTSVTGVPIALTEVGPTAPGLYFYLFADPGPLVPTPPALQLSKDNYMLGFLNVAEVMYDMREYSRELRDINTQGS